MLSTISTAEVFASGKVGIGGPDDGGTGATSSSVDQVAPSAHGASNSSTTCCGRGTY